MKLEEEFRQVRQRQVVKTLKHFYTDMYYVLHDTFPATPSLSEEEVNILVEKNIRQNINNNELDDMYNKVYNIKYKS